MGINKRITEAKNKLDRANHMLWNCQDILHFSDMAMSFEEQMKATQELDSLELQIEEYKSLIASLEKQYTVIKVSLIATGLIICSINLYLLYG